MDVTISLAAVTIIGTLAGVAGYFLMRAKYQRELAVGKKREGELSSKVYEIAVLSEIGERIGYSLDGAKIIEIISGSLGQLLPYSTVSHMVLTSGEKITFACSVHESVSSNFIKDVKGKMLAAVSEMLQEPKLEVDVDESISGTILDQSDTSPVASFFNLPIVISGRLAGIINVASATPGLYQGDDTQVLYRIAQDAAEAVSKLQEVLENEKGKLSQAVESLSDGILMVDTDYRLVLANRKLRSLLSIDEKAQIFDVVNALAGTFDLRTKMEEAIEAEGSLPPEEIVLQDLVLAVYVSRVIDRRRQKPLGVVALFHDVTDAKSLEKLRQDFMAMMVHELRAPLTSIRSTVEIIKSTGTAGVKPDELARYLATIEETSASMLELVNDLLDVAKVEAGKFDVLCDEGDLAQVVLERLEAFKPQIVAKNLKVEAIIDRDLPRAWFDKVRIKQVINNLLSNAIKYTDSGTISVKAILDKVNGQPIDILVSVADTGIGIEPDQAQNLFAKFDQLAAGRTRAGLKSSGLGLYITKRIVESSGGRIWVESAGPGTGSTFYFTVILAGSAKSQGEQSLAIPTNACASVGEPASGSSTIGDFTTQKWRT